jgi:hypothetical protein
LSWKGRAFYKRRIYTHTFIDPFKAYIVISEVLAVFVITGKKKHARLLNLDNFGNKKGSLQGLGLISLLII